MWECTDCGNTEDELVDGTEECSECGGDMDLA